MSRGNYLVQGDKTACGGVIVTGCEDHTLFGKAVACEGEHVTCGKHPGLYRIVGGIPFDTVHGRHMAGTSYSRSSCPCQSRFIPSMFEDTYDFGSEEAAPRAAAPVASEPVQHAQTAHRHHHPAQTQQQEPLPTTCACDRDITMAEFRLIATGITDETRLKSYLDELNLCMPWNGITTCRAKAHFLAQACAETGNFSSMVEGGGASQPYNPYYGRGILQLTHSDNYRAYDNYANIDSITTPDIITTLPYSVRSGIWVYENLLNLIDFTNNDDFNYITAQINGGFNGYNTRLSSFNSIVGTLKADHLNLKEENNEFSFQDSEIYQYRVYSLDWGKWHDPGLSSYSGPTKSIEKSLEGYRRARPLCVSHHEHRNVDFIDRRIQALS
jgi:predicted chitinase/uncharacterized Zn-binding protein involved in type VI secretion